MTTDLESFLDGKTTSAKFERIGQVIGGEIIADPRMVQQRDYDTDELMFFPDGNPQMQMIVKVQVQPATSDDDGTRAFYIKGQLKTALIDALKATGEKVPRRGGSLWVKLTGEEPVTLKNGKPGSPKKIHAAKYTPPTGAAGEFLGGSTTFGNAPAAAAAVGAVMAGAPVASFDNGPRTSSLACPPGVTPENWSRMDAGQQAQMYDALGLPHGGQQSPRGGSAFADEPPF